jgi:mono/diheme cytochrome c family protein
MPIGLYRGMSDEDVRAIVAYLRTVKPIRNEMPKSTYNIPLPTSYGSPVSGVTAPSRSDKVDYGGYLAGPLGHCIECHTPMVKGRFDFEHQLGAGGFQFPGPWGVSVSSNITPHADGIADMSDADVAKAVRTGIRADGSRLMPPMGVHYYANISDEDMEALVAYLRSLKPVPTP